MAGTGSGTLTVDKAKREFKGMSSVEVYHHLCRKYECKPNSLFAATLNTAPDFFEMDRLDLSKNMVGPKGIVPVMELARLSESLTTVDLQDNYLDNKAVNCVAKALKNSPCLEMVDFSGNPISWTAGMSILDLVTENTNIIQVGMDNTYLKPNIIATICERTKMNQALRAKHKAATTLNPSNHPLSIQLRALKRLFNELLQREGVDGKLPKRFIIDGYKENMRLQSRELELERHSVAFYDELKKRCNADAMGLITWETFLVVSMVDDIGFDASEIERLKECFYEFDTDHSGYIDMVELRALIKALTGENPTEAFVIEKMKMYDLDGSNTITLDEFILMMVDKGPQIGMTSLLPKFVHPQKARR